MTGVARTSPELRGITVLLAALALLIASAPPATAHHVRGFSEARGDANGINDQLEGFCCDVSTPAASQPQADIVATSFRTLYRHRKPVATQLRITMASAIEGGRFSYELRMRSARCGSIFGLFTTRSGRISEECDTSKTRITHDVRVDSRGRTLIVRFPYNLNRAAGLLRPGDTLSHFQTISNLSVTTVMVPRLDWANAPYRMTFRVGR